MNECKKIIMKTEIKMMDNGYPTKETYFHTPPHNYIRIHKKIHVQKLNRKRRKNHKRYYIHNCINERRKDYMT